MAKTTVEYTQASSVHGVQYIFESGANLAVSKAIWVIFVAATAGVGIFWSIEVSHLQVQLSWKLGTSFFGPLHRQV